MNRLALLSYIMAWVGGFMVAFTIVGATSQVFTLGGVCVYLTLTMCMVGVWDSRAKWDKRTRTHGTQVPTPMATVHALPRRKGSNIVVSRGEDFFVGTYTKEDTIPFDTCFKHGPDCNVVGCPWNSHQ